MGWAALMTGLWRGATTGRRSDPEAYFRRLRDAEHIAKETVQATNATTICRSVQRIGCTVIIIMMIKCT